MASWTDRIPTFNPYVEQQPVDAMLKVGMYKQQKYEEGVQRIQTSIDNIAGLDIAAGLDKKYLQSKLDSLGNNLNFVAGGDFSNFQLVNSVNGSYIFKHTSEAGVGAIKGANCDAQC